MTQLIVNSECSIVTFLYRCPISCYYYICPLNVLCAPEHKFVGMILNHSEILTTGTRTT